MSSPPTRPDGAAARGRDDRASRGAARPSSLPAHHPLAAFDAGVLARAVEQSPSSILITDRDGRIQYVNPSFERISGYSRAEVLGRTPGLMRAGITERAVYEELWGTITAGGTWTGELMNRRKDGSAVHESLRISPVVGDDGTITHFVAVKEDITERTQLEAQLRQSQKMQAVGQLAGGVAHDFNNLLTIILGSVELVGTRPGLDATARADLEDVRDAAMRAAELTRQLLSFSRQKPSRPRRFDLGETVRAAERMLARIVGDLVHVEIDCAAPCPVTGDPGSVEQVLVNLVVNARDAMPQGGVVTIRTGSSEAPPPWAAAPDLPRAGRWATLTVEDTGSGMDAATCARVFEPFFTTKPVGRGTGLGLSIVYGIVSQMGGRVGVDSVPGRGTRFGILLPRTPGELDEPTTPLAPVPARAVTGRLLLVEDERAVRALMRRALERAGHVVYEARHGADALLLWKALRGAVDAVVTDLRMPEMDGHALVERLRAEEPTLPAVVCSGYDADIERLQERPNQWFVQKPFTGDELVTAVAAAVHEARTRVAPQRGIAAD